MSESLVYILRRWDPEVRVHIHKIGISMRPRVRARSIGATLVYLECGGKRRERELHRQFAHLRYRRNDLDGATEWFVDEYGEIEAYIHGQAEFAA